MKLQMWKVFSSCGCIYIRTFHSCFAFMRCIISYGYGSGFCDAILSDSISSSDSCQPLLAAQLSSRSEEHTSELQSRPHISYAVFCLKKKKNTYTHQYK